MTTFRRITAADVPALAEFAIVGMRPHLYPHLRLDAGKVRAVVEHFTRSETDFHLGAFDGSRPVAALAAVVQPMLWFERHEAHVVIFRSEHPGAGRRLLGSLMEWAAADPRIRQVQLAAEFDADPRQMRMLARRFGFQRSQQVALWAKE